MPIQPTQADLDDYNQRMALMQQRKPVYWGPDANAYSYERHVREEQEKQRQRELEVLAGRGGRSNDLGSAEANRKADIERLLAKELEMEDWQPPARENLPQKVGGSGPPARQNLPQKVSESVPPARQNLGADPVQYFGNGMFSVPPNELPKRSKAAEVAAAQGGETPEPYAEAGSILPIPFQTLKLKPVNPGDAEQAEKQRVEDFATWKNPLQKFLGSIPRKTVNPNAVEVLKGALGGRKSQKDYGPIDDPNAGSTRRKLTLKKPPKAADDGTLNTMDELQAAMADPNRTVDFTQPGPLSERLIALAGTSPEEKMEDTHTSMQRALSGRNTKARQSRGQIGVPSEEVSEQRIKANTRNKRTGQVDELSNMDSRLGGLLAANQSQRIQQLQEDNAHSDAMAEMRRMQDERKAERGAKQEAGEVPQGPRGASEAALMRKRYVRLREDALKEALAGARNAIQNGETEYKYAGTGDPRVDRHVDSVVSTLMGRAARERGPGMAGMSELSPLEQQLVRRDLAAKGRLGAIGQVLAGRQTAKQNELTAEQTAEQNELNRQNTLENSRILMSGRGKEGDPADPNMATFDEELGTLQGTLKNTTDPKQRADLEAQIQRAAQAKIAYMKQKQGAPPPAPARTGDGQRKHNYYTNLQNSLDTATTSEEAAEFLVAEMNAGRITESEARTRAGFQGADTVAAFEEARVPSFFEKLFRSHAPSGGGSYGR